jgi:hypothetical protein
VSAQRRSPACLRIAGGHAKVLEQGRSDVPQVVDPDDADLMGGADTLESSQSLTFLQ